MSRDLSECPIHGEYMEFGPHYDCQQCRDERERVSAPPAVGVTDALVTSVRNAVLACGHHIIHEQIILKQDGAKPGNALAQLHERLRAALESVVGKDGWHLVCDRTPPPEQRVHVLILGLDDVASCTSQGQWHSSGRILTGSEIPTHWRFFGELHT